MSPKISSSSSSSSRSSPVASNLNSRIAPSPVQKEVTRRRQNKQITQGKSNQLSFKISSISPSKHCIIELKFGK